MAKRRESTRWLLLLWVLALSFPLGCWNGSHIVQNGVQSAGRFELTVEPSRTDVQGTHFLVDSATGDMWHLEREGARFAWTRLADAPEDAADLMPEEADPLDQEGE